MSEVPASLQGFVRLDEDGLDLPRVATPEVARRVALAGAAVFGGLPALGALLLALALQDPGVGALALLPVFPGALAAGLGWAVGRGARGMARATAEGIDGEPWGAVAALRLQGDPVSRTVTVVLERPDGERTCIQTWHDVRDERFQGWDHAGVQWCAGRLAHLAGVPLIDELPARAVWAEAVRADDRKRGDLPHLYDDPVVPPELTHDHDGAVLTVRGGTGQPVTLGTVSMDASVPVRVTRTHVEVRTKRVPLAAVRDVIPWFGRRHGSSRVGRVVVVTDSGRWTAVERRLGDVTAGEISGAATVLRQMIDDARAARDRTDRGSARDVPEALRAVAARPRAQGEG